MSHVMQATIELPKAFSLRDDRELRLIPEPHGTALEQLGTPCA
jgi:hypothetical protein